MLDRESLLECAQGAREALRGEGEALDTLLAERDVDDEVDRVGALARVKVMDQPRGLVNLLLVAARRVPPHDFLRGVDARQQAKPGGNHTRRERVREREKVRENRNEGSDFASERRDEGLR